MNIKFKIGDKVRCLGHIAPVEYIGDIAYYNSSIDRYGVNIYDSEHVFKILARPCEIWHIDKWREITI